MGSSQKFPKGNLQKDCFFLLGHFIEHLLEIMILDYLYYKLYRTARKGSLKDIASFAAAIYMGGLIGTNMIVINAFLAKTTNIPFLFHDTKLVAATAVVLMVLIKLMYNRKKLKKISEKYQHESNNQRTRGNILVWIYVGISFLSIFAIAFYKPGQL